MRRGAKERVDVLIAGAGPAGLAAAMTLAGAKRDVLLVDSRRKIGTPLRCGEVTGWGYFQFFGLEPREGWIRHRPRNRRIFITINRELCEYEIAGIAAEKGIRVEPETSVTGIGEFDGTGRLVTLVGKEGKRRIHARMVLAADGVSSTVARLAGIDTYLPPDRVVAGLAYRIAGLTLRTPEEITHEPLPYPYPAYPHYFWVIPNGPDEANVGLYLPGLDGARSKELLDRMIAETDAFEGGRIVQTVAGIIPDCRPMDKPYADGLMVLGAAARMIEPMSGGGIWTAAISGGIAAKIWLALGDTPAHEELLVEYKKRLVPIYRFLEKRWETREDIENKVARGLPMHLLLGPSDGGTFHL